MKTKEILFPAVAEENQKNLMELRRRLNKRKSKENWVLCLGAGVSISVGLPNWFKLLAKISARILPAAGKEELSDQISDEAFYTGVSQFYKGLSYDNIFFDKLSDAFEGGYVKTFESINALEAAEYVRNYLARSQEYSDEDENRNGGEFQKRINEHMNFLIGQACAIDIEMDDSNKKIQRSTLAAVARLMKSEKDHLIHNAITYNYDNLLETYLRNLCGCAPEKIHSIDKKDKLRDFNDKNNWNIYHVHGRIPVIPYPGEGMSSSVILTESDYYQEEQINYSWTNILQSYVMLRANLIFIGFSGTDYNFRRIVKYVNQENTVQQQRFIFFSVDDIVSAVFSKEIEKESKLEKGKKLEECIADINKENSEYAFEKLFINYLIHAQTVYWKQHGLTVIWSSHEELYDDLESLH